jgi:hypothetical protein
MNFIQQRESRRGLDGGLWLQWRGGWVVVMGGRLRQKQKGAPSGDAWLAARDVWCNGWEVLKWSSDFHYYIFEIHVL